MAKSFSWTCPYCNRDTTITDENISDRMFGFDDSNKDGQLYITFTAITCPNPSCREYEIKSYLRNSRKDQFKNVSPGKIIMKWDLKPNSNAKQFPEYAKIPTPIIDDYKEACLIKSLSPKASATLSRRCLQGIIRDFWEVSKDTLFQEINELQGKIELSTWEAIDAVRGIGNIGAHMEKDINVIVDVDENEAQLLIGLIEILLDDWYIARANRKIHLEKIKTLGGTKKQAQKQGKRILPTNPK